MNTLIKQLREQLEFHKGQWVKYKSESGVVTYGKVLEAIVYMLYSDEPIVRYTVGWFNSSSSSVDATSPRLSAVTAEDIAGEE